MGKPEIQLSGKSRFGTRKSSARRWVVWMHEYFYGAQSSTYSFIRVPTVLFTDDQYKYISAEAKVLYGLLLARMDLSAKNGWLDDQGRVYIICTLSEIMEKL
ncbi:MAG: replication initiator protein A, partial [Lachnospiraceae bacterium]